MDKHIINKNNKHLLRALDTSKHRPPYFTEEEKKGIYQIVKMRLGLSEDPCEVVLYNYCKYSLFNSGGFSRADKDQSTFGMSRSLSLYFTLICFGGVCLTCREFSWTNVFYTVMSGTLALLLYYRCIRFSVLRHVNIMRSFYYSVLFQKIEKKNKSILEKD